VLTYNAQLNVIADKLATDSLTLKINKSNGTRKQCKKNVNNIELKNKEVLSNATILKNGLIIIADYTPKIIFVNGYERILNWSQ
jgi:hypothetical protein